MAYEKKEYDFILFYNESKQTNRPAFSGTIHIGGQEIPLVAWNRTSKNGHKMVVGSKAKVLEKKPEVKEEPFVADEIPF